MHSNDFFLPRWYFNYSARGGLSVGSAFWEKIVDLDIDNYGNRSLTSLLAALANVLWRAVLLLACLLLVPAM